MPSGFEGVRSGQNPSRKSPQANFAPFEVKMADFPQLAEDLLSKTSHPAAQKEHWSPSYQTTSPQTLATSWKVNSCFVKTSDVSQF